MKDLTCEKVLMALMAVADGEQPQLPPEEMKEHLSACEACRNEAVQMQRVHEIFRQATRRETTINLWPAINSRLAKQPLQMCWQPYAIVGILLLGYKLVEMLPEANPGWAIKLVPLIIFGALLVFLRENPFRINTELIMEK